MAKKSFKQWAVTGSDLAAGTNTKGVKIAGNKADKFKGVKASGHASTTNSDGQSNKLDNAGWSNKGYKGPNSEVKNDKFLGPGVDKVKKAASGVKAKVAVEKNKKLMKSFDGPRTFKDKDGKVRPTKEWAAYLKKNGSEVVSKSRLKNDHISQVTNAWAKKHAAKD